jgi:hypothetical protein
MSKTLGRDTSLVGVSASFVSRQHLVPGFCSPTPPGHRTGGFSRGNVRFNQLYIIRSKWNLAQTQDRNPHRQDNCAP